MEFGSASMKTDIDDTTECSFFYVEVERGLLRNNDLTFLLIKNEYIYTKSKTQK